VILPYTITENTYESTAALITPDFVADVEDLKENRGF
jgi:hypothetical protein